jgi:uncharacterized cupredoxin-like copper-binding protein
LGDLNFQEEEVKSFHLLLNKVYRFKKGEPVMKQVLSIILAVGIVTAVSTGVVRALDLDFSTSVLTVQSSDEIKIEDVKVPVLDPNLKYWTMLKWNPATFVFDLVDGGARETKKSSEWVSEADWGTAETKTVVMHEESPTVFHFMPNDLTLTAGKPYIIKVQNPSTNSSKHYFTAEIFYKNIALRKAQTADCEYKAPYLNAVELLIGGEIDIYFVAVIPGEYGFLCTIPGHAAKGMTGTITVVGDPGAGLELEVAGDWDRDLDTDARTSGSHAVWDTKQTVTVDIVEGGTPDDLVFDPAHLNLTKGQAYVLKIQNAATNASKHYWTAGRFYRTLVTRKAQDSQAEVKVPYFTAIEFLIGGTTELYHVPTKSGRYGLLCTIPGHAARGMTGSVTVP